MHIISMLNVRDIFEYADKGYNSLSDIFDNTTVQDLQVLYKVLDKFCGVMNNNLLNDFRFPLNKVLIFLENSENIIDL